MTSTTAAIDDTIKILDDTMGIRAADDLRGIRQRSIEGASTADTIAEIRIVARTAPTDIKQALTRLAARLKRDDNVDTETAAASKAGGMQATISTGPKGRTTTVTLPDGTTATRTSKTRDYTHAVVVTEDNHAHAAEVQQLVDRRRAYVEALEAWIARGSNMSELKAYPSASLSYAEQQAGVSKTEYYLPGFEPVKQTIRGSRYSGSGGSYWSDSYQFSLPNPDNKRRTKYHNDQGEGLTDWERYGPQHALKQQREFIEKEQAQADKLRTGPQHNYSVWRWSGDAANAQSYANQVDTARSWRTTRVVAVEGSSGRRAGGEPESPTKPKPTEAEREAAREAAKAAQKQQRADSDAMFINRRLETVKRIAHEGEGDTTSAGIAERVLSGMSDGGVLLLARYFGVAIPQDRRQRDGLKVAIVNKILKRPETDLRYVSTDELRAMARRLVGGSISVSGHTRADLINVIQMNQKR
jgi:hypothetical protein